MENSSVPSAEDVLTLLVLVTEEATHVLTCSIAIRGRWHERTRDVQSNYYCQLWTWSRGRARSMVILRQRQLGSVTLETNAAPPQSTELEGKTKRGLGLDKRTASSLPSSTSKRPFGNVRFFPALCRLLCNYGGPAPLALRVLKLGKGREGRES